MDGSGFHQPPGGRRQRVGVSAARRSRVRRAAPAQFHEVEQNRHADEDPKQHDGGDARPLHDCTEGAEEFRRIH
jgi:hypothetical protein